MTTNQIAYWNLVETRRANQAREADNSLRTAEDARSHRATEIETRRANLAREGETARHNLVGEALNRSQHAETVRANLAKEYLQRKDISEKERSNRANEMLKSQAQAETHRSNIAGENLKALELNEKERSNRAQESLTRSDIDRKTLADQEVARHNLAAEGETVRHNVRNERESHRHNLQAEINESAKVSETARHNRAQEGLQKQANYIDLYNVETKHVGDLYDYHTDLMRVGVEQDKVFQDYIKPFMKAASDVAYSTWLNGY